MYANRGYLAGSATTETVLTSTAVIASFLAPTKLTVVRLKVTVTTTISSSKSVVVTFYSRPAFGSSSGQTSLGTITIPTGVAAGTTYYKDVESDITEGYFIEADVTTASTSAGKGFAHVDVVASSEDPRNVSSMVASA